MFNLPIQSKHITGPLIVMALCLIIALLGLNDFLQYERELIRQGEVWRLLTGHFTHSNYFHLLLNCGGIVLIWALHGEYYTRGQYLAYLAILSLYSSAALYIFYGQNEIYHGLSGILHGVIIIGALIDCEKKYKTGYLLFIGVWLKIIWEQYSGPDPQIGELIDARVATEAHLIGVIAGILVYAKIKLKQLNEQ